MSWWLDANRNHYSYTYDDQGRAVTGRGINGIFNATINSQPDQQRTIFTDSTGRQHITEYNNTGRVTAGIAPGGRVTRYQHNQFDQLTSVTDPLGRTTTLVYDNDGDLIKVTQPGGRISRFTYTNHQITQVTDAADRCWAYAYANGLARPVTVTDPAESTTSYTYRDDGALTAVTNPLGHTTTVRCSPAGLPISLTDPLGHETRLEYDAAGRPTRIVDPLGAATGYTYTVDGTLLSRALADGSTETWEYDGELNPINYTDYYGRETQYQYGPFDRLLAKVLPNGDRTEHHYTTEGDLLSVIDPLGRAWTYTYNQAGDLAEQTDVNNTTTTYTHDPYGRLTAQTNSEDHTVTYTYDPATDYLAAKTVDTPTGKLTTTYTRDQIGRLLQATNPVTTLTRAYDPVGRVVEESWDGRRITHTYNAAGQRVTRTTPTGSISTWEYDHAGQPTHLSTSLPHSPSHDLEFGYDPVGRETNRSLGDLDLTQEWNSIGQLLTQTLTGPANQAVNHTQYTYQGPTRLTGINDQLAGNHTYTLDQLDRITTATTPGGPETYTYDPAGTITHGNWPGQEDTPTRELHGTQTHVAGPITYQYDKAGRVIMRRHKQLSTKPKIWHYTWDAENRLTTTTTPDGTTWTYTYDTTGRRTTKHATHPNHTSQTHHHTWDHNTLTETQTPRHTTTWNHHPHTTHPLTQTTTRTPPSQTDLDQSTAEVPSNPHDWGQPHDHPDQEQDWYDTQFRTIITNLIGTPTHLTTPTGHTATLHTTTWGQTPTQNTPIQNAPSQNTPTPLRFPGQHHDPETELHYNHHRYYDPTTATYLTPDPLGLQAATNPNAYVPNPTTWTDPYGLVACDPGSIDYGTLDDLGRPTGVSAHITPKMVGTGSKAKQGILPPGFGGASSGHARAHLLGAQLGGSGSEPRNLVTLNHIPANTPTMRGCENQVRAALVGGQTVQYDVVPIYRGTDLVPIGVTLSAHGSGGFELFVSVRN